MYGHLAVVFFLVVSGFSLAVGPARHGWRLGGVGQFARRRAWRILPPYWAALGLSLLVDWTVTPQPHSAAPTARSVAVYGRLQDLAVAPTPNGTFWSIAVEVELYLVFPLLLLLRRRLGAAATLVLATLPAVAVGLFGPGGSLPPVDKLSGLAPQLAPLFAFGLVGAGIVAARDRVRRLPWPGLAALAAAPVLAVIAGTGTVWTVRHYVWIDLAIGPAMTLLLVAVTTGRPEALVRLLDTRPVRGPRPVLRQPLPGPSADRRRGEPNAVPVRARRPPACRGSSPRWSWPCRSRCLLARLFAAVFEIPFQQHRGWPRHWRLPGRHPDAPPAPQAAAPERVPGELPSGARERVLGDRPAQPRRSTSETSARSADRWA